MQLLGLIDNCFHSKHKTYLHLFLQMTVQVHAPGFDGGAHYCCCGAKCPRSIWFLTDKDISRTNTQSSNITHVGISNTCIVASHISHYMRSASSWFQHQGVSDRKQHQCFLLLLHWSRMCHRCSQQ